MAQRRKINPEQGLWEDILRPPVVRPGIDTPPHPASWRPAPLVAGDKDLVKIIMDLLKIAPELRGKIDRVQSGPNADFINLATAIKGDPNFAFELTNVLGMMGDDKTMYVRPRTAADDEFRPATIAHEAAHAAGLQHGDPRMEEAADRAAARTKSVNVGKRYK